MWLGQSNYVESEYYHIIAADMRKDVWKEHIAPEQDAIIVLEGVSMYFKPDELANLLSSLADYFKSVCILMDCYTEKAAKVSKYKNPINEVGVTVVYGCDDPVGLAKKSGLEFKKEYDMTPQKYINELQGMERKIFKNLFAGSFAKSMYRMYEYTSI